jgi:hypothetical protein
LGKALQLSDCPCGRASDSIWELTTNQDPTISDRKKLSGTRDREVSGRSYFRVANIEERVGTIL